MLLTSVSGASLLPYKVSAVFRLPYFDVIGLAQFLHHQYVHLIERFLFDWHRDAVLAESLLVTADT